jgi:hypothetical protein
VSTFQNSFLLGASSLCTVGRIYLKHRHVNHHPYGKLAGFTENQHVFCRKSTGLMENDGKSPSFPCKNHHVLAQDVLQLIANDAIQPAFVHARCQTLTTDLAVGPFNNQLG